MKKTFAVMAILMGFGLILSYTATPAAKNADLYRKWMLVSFKNYKKEDLAKIKAAVDFSPVKSNPKQFGAFMGCNRMFFNADFKQNGEENFRMLVLQ